MQNEKLFPPKDGWIADEIERPYEETFKIADYDDALLIDEQVIVAYKRLSGEALEHYLRLLSQRSPRGARGYDPKALDTIFIARDRSVPIKVGEKGGREVMYSEEWLKGTYAMLIFDVSYRNWFYIGDKYRLTFENSFEEAGRRLANIKMESTEPIVVSFIDGKSDYSAYLANLNRAREQGK